MNFKNVKLKDVLALKSIKSGITSDLFKNTQLTESAIEKTLNCGKINSTSIKIDANGEECDFENQLHRDSEKEVFLLESRLFECYDGEMVNSYLMLLDKDFNLITNYDDCVWGYANWEVVS